MVFGAAKALVVEVASTAVAANMTVMRLSIAFGYLLPATWPRPTGVSKAVIRCSLQMVCSASAMELVEGTSQLQAGLGTRHSLGFS